MWEEEAAALGKQTGVVQRRSTLRGTIFVERLAAGRVSSPTPSLNEWVAVRAELGIAIREPSLQERIDSQAGLLLAGMPTT